MRRACVIAVSVLALAGAAPSSAQASPNHGAAACEHASDSGVGNVKHCAPYTVRVEAVAGVAPVSGTLTVECREGFVRGATTFGALTPDSAATVTRTEPTPTSYSIDYTLINTTSGGIYLETECHRVQ